MKEINGFISIRKYKGKNKNGIKQYATETISKRVAVAKACSSWIIPFRKQFWYWRLWYWIMGE
tara:strand:+ start:1240 stop:1428 length:189 start_codon:yes stop_codon:yes gene_type:complete